MHNTVNITQTAVWYVNYHNKAINKKSKEVKKPQGPALGIHLKNCRMAYCFILFGTSFAKSFIIIFIFITTNELRGAMYLLVSITPMRNL